MINQRLHPRRALDRHQQPGLGHHLQVYYDDLTLAGGAVTPIATTNFALATSAAAPGRIFIGLIRTTEGMSGAVIYHPTTHQDLGTNSTLNPASAYDSEAVTFAELDGYFSPASYGDCKWAGFADWPGAQSITAVPTAAAQTHRQDGGIAGTRQPPEGASAPEAMEHSCLVITTASMSRRCLSSRHLISAPSPPAPPSWASR